LGVTRRVRWVSSSESSREPHVTARGGRRGEVDVSSDVSSGEVREERQAELVVSEICDSVLKRLKRVASADAGAGGGEASPTRIIDASVPIAGEAIARVHERVEEEDRRWLLQRLHEILEIAMQRVTGPKTPAGDRVKWSRIVISAAQACNAVLRDVEIEALKQQIAELKALTLAKLSDEEEDGEEHEDRRDQTRDGETPAEG